MKLIPTKTQFISWSLPSKIAYISFILMILFFIVQLLVGASKEGQQKTHEKLDTIDNKLSQAINGKTYKPLNEKLKHLVQQSLANLNNKQLNISIYITPGSNNKNLLGKAVSTP